LNHGNISAGRSMMLLWSEMRLALSRILVLSSVNRMIAMFGNCPGSSYSLMLQICTPLRAATSDAVLHNSSGAERNESLLVRMPARDQRLGLRSPRACDWATRIRKCAVDAPPNKSKPSVAPVRFSHARLPSFFFGSLRTIDSFAVDEVDLRIVIMRVAPSN